MEASLDAAPTPGEDSELMRRVQAGDEAALGELMRRWERPVKAVIGRLVLNAREAEDLAQETFVRVWQQRDRFRADAAFRPWVFAIAVNLARNRLRWWRSRPEVGLDAWTDGAADGATGATSAEGAERARAVRDAIAALPTDLREAIVLAEYEQLSHAEIAEAVGATPKAVENRVARARAKLRTALARWL
ncbi:sigma-70 family RNA polymerase sigma factor [Opitutus sp. ER46]|uniref:RNA polymerase sigma factor n=1 Tax=Opitutus sp. ER46 TaxID=2161864 RepID=UPI000D3159CF|nr:sigma-70 family RNA polymerase sigma factor [Opitutus sp. ER46]PTX98464.1 RNA polymerase subunit sigma-24 [Opitutus sp. ER46]